MIPRALFLLTLCAALGSGLIAGVFFAFSSFVMPALGRLPPSQGIAAMQSINVVVINRWFLGVFLGTAAVSAFLGVTSLFFWSGGGSKWLMAGALLYLLGTLTVTRAYHIPRNTALQEMPAESAQAIAYWPKYQSEWNPMNHVRGAASLAASALFILALLSKSGSYP